jgi:hypothetical protein
MLGKYINRSDGLPPKKVAILIRALKNDLGLQAPSVCCISCEWSKVYIAQANGSIDTTVKENNRHLRLGQPAKSDVAEPSVTDNLIQFQDTRFFYQIRLYGNTLEGVNSVRTASKDMRDGGLIVSEYWKLLISLRKRAGRNPFS